MTPSGSSQCPPRGPVQMSPGARLWTSPRTGPHPTKVLSVPPIFPVTSAPPQGGAALFSERPLGWRRGRGKVRRDGLPLWETQTGVGKGRVQAWRTYPKWDWVGSGRTGLRADVARGQGRAEPHSVGDGAPHFAARRLPRLPGDTGGTGGREQLRPHHSGCAQDSGQCHLPFHVSGCVKWGRDVGFGLQRLASSPGPGHTDQEIPRYQAAGSIGLAMARALGLRPGRVRTGLDLLLTHRVTLYRSSSSPFE